MRDFLSRSTPLAACPNLTCRRAGICHHLAQNGKCLKDNFASEDDCRMALANRINELVIQRGGNTIGLPSELHIYDREQDRKAIFVQSVVNSGLDLNSVLNAQDEKSRNLTIQKYLDQFSIIKRELLTEDEVRESYSSDDDFWQIFQNYQEALLASGGIHEGDENGEESV